MFWNACLISIGGSTSPETMWGVVGRIQAKANNKSVERGSEIISSEWSETWTSVCRKTEKWCNRRCGDQGEIMTNSWHGQSGELGMLGSGMMWTPSWNWRVLDHLIRHKAPESVNLMTCQARCWSELNKEAEATTRFDLRRKEKNAVVNKFRRAAWDGVVKSRERRMETKMSGMIGCFWHGEEPIVRLSPFLVRPKVKC